MKRVTATTAAIMKRIKGAISSMDATKWFHVVGLISAVALGVGFVTAVISVGLSWRINQEQKVEIANAFKDAGVANENAGKANARAEQLAKENLQIRAALANVETELADARRRQAEAEERLERLRKKAAPRAISKTLEPLEKGAKGRAEILYQDDLPEAYRFACNLRLCLFASGWEVAEPAPIPRDPERPHVPPAEAAGATNTDVTLKARWLESEPLADTPYATLCRFFGANDLGLHCQQDESLPPDLFRIVIGPRW